MLLSVPPRYSVTQVLGFMKGKSVISFSRNHLRHHRNFSGQGFWARGYYFSTVGHDKAIVRQSILHQEEEDKRLDHLELFKE